jgi:hypothetical protein
MLAWTYVFSDLPQIGVPTGCFCCNKAGAVAVRDTG